MNGKNIRWLRGCLAFGLTLAVLSLGQFLWHNYAVAQPLDKVLQDVDGVEKITWQDSRRQNEPVNIFVTLDHPANLQKTYMEISERAARVLGRQPFRVVIRDHRTPELEQLFYDVHYYFQEAITNGNFSLMADKVREKARSQGAEANIYVDGQYIYVQLTRQNDSFYTLIPRMPERGEGKYNGLR